MAEIYDLVVDGGERTLSKRESKTPIKTEDTPAPKTDRPALEGLVRTALFHPLEKFRESGIARLQKNNQLCSSSGGEKILAGGVINGGVYIRVQTTTGKIEDVYLFDVPDVLYGVENPESYPFVIGRATPQKGPGLGPAA